VSTRKRYQRIMPMIVSTTEIAQAAGVGVSAVSNWIQRWPDFPQPIDSFGHTTLYAVDEVDRCLRGRGYATSWNYRGTT
jgi:hypothetical protein